MNVEKDILTSNPQTDNNLCMLGRVVPRGFCPTCKNKWQYYHTTRDEGYHCPTCNTFPKRYRIDARAFKCGFIYSGRKQRPFRLYEEAKRQLEAMRKDYDDGKFQSDKWLPEELRENLFENKVKKWLRNYDEELKAHAKSKSRVQELHNVCNRFFIPEFKGKDIRDITDEDVEKLYHKLLDKNYSKKYIKDILSDLKTLFIKYRRNNVPIFPIFTVTPTKEKQRLGIDRQLAIGPHIPEKYRFAFQILLATGMRPCELLALQKNDLKDGEIIVYKSRTENTLKLCRKSGGEVSYRLPLSLWQDLIEYTKDVNSDALLFPFGENRLYKVWKKACQKAGVKYITLYQAVRHSKASEINEEFKKKAQIAIAKQLGHSNLTTQKHYLVSNMSPIQTDTKKDI